MAELTSGENSDDFDVVRALADAWKASQRLSERLFSQTGISLPELRILRTLSSSQQPTAMVHLASELYTTPASITALIDRLEASQFVVRERSSEDRRVINARITQMGEDMLRRGIEAYHAELQKVLSLVSGEDVRQLILILKKLNDAFGEQ